MAKLKTESAVVDHNEVTLWSLRQSADYLGLSTRTLTRWIASGKLPAFKAGRQIRIRPADVAETLQKIG
jgi:excisionase family DNA binding protein